MPLDNRTEMRVYSHYQGTHEQRIRGNMTPQQAKFADELVKQNGDAKAAYLVLNPDATQRTLETASSRLANNLEIKHKVRQILEQEGITLQHCSKRLKRFMSRANQTGLKATELAFKLHGALDDDRNAAPLNVDAIEINIVQQVTHAAQPEAPQISHIVNGERAAAQDNASA